MEYGKEKQEVTLKYPCDNCFILPVCVCKYPWDILNDCILVTRYVMSQRKKGIVQFPIKELQDRVKLVIEKPLNKEILIINVREYRKDHIISLGGRSMKYYKHGGKDGKGAITYL